MNLDRAVLALAGTMILIGAVPIALVSTWWLLPVGFVGLNLLQSSLTGFCPAATILARFGISPGCAFTPPGPPQRQDTSDDRINPDRPAPNNAPDRGPRPGVRGHDHSGRHLLPRHKAGRWVILFSHPADFTPVCTSEFMTFASMQDEFQAYNTELIGLSIDGLYSHIAWLRTIKEKTTFRDLSNIEVKFPLIEDITMEVAKKYGMIMPGEDSTKAVRAVFVIDPSGVIRTMIYYPLSLGRN
ncbi:MAG: redoxin domain-containing protein, partial [Nocardioides sp.]